MKLARVVACAALAAVLSNGCGTACNFASGDPEIYGGPLFDMKCLSSPAALGSGMGSDGKGAAIFLAIVFADIPVSFVADTLTLPLAIYLRQNDHSVDRKLRVADEPPRPVQFAAP